MSGGKEDDAEAVPLTPGFDGMHPAAGAASLSERKRQMDHQRVNGGLLAKPERLALQWLVERIPARVQPDHLTAVGVAGAILVLIGFICANVSPYFVGLIVLGLLINWYGDSLDGTLARYRQIERPRIGYFIDHSCDLVSQTFIFIGLGFSPYFTICSALLALSMYLLMSSYTYLKVMTLRTHQLSYGGMGATELRVALIMWSLVAMWTGFDPDGSTVRGRPMLDAVIGSLWVMVLLGFIWMLRSDISKFSTDLSQYDKNIHLPPVDRPVSTLDRFIGGSAQ